MMPENWVAHEKHKNEAQKALCTYEPQTVCREAKMKTTPAWGSLRYERSGG